MPQPAHSGRRLPLGRSRALVLDVLRLAHNVPIFPLERQMALAELAAARQAAGRRISWVAIFAKAFALVAREMCVFRRSFMNWPWPHLYEHAQSVATVSIHRQYLGEDWLFWQRFEAPESLPLVRLQMQLDRTLQGDVSDVFRQQLQLSLVPSLLRRLIWWGRLNLSPARRAKWLGTFGISVLAAQGCYNRRPPHFLTSCVTYGPLDAQGRMPVSLHCDHRVLDGFTAAQGLMRLEEKLRGELRDELLAIVPARRAA
jgi:hypothetical protein